MPFVNSIYPYISVYRLDHRCGKRKKTKTYGLEGLNAPLRQGSSLRQQPCPTNGPTATRQLVRQSFVFYLILFKKHCVCYSVALAGEIAILFTSRSLFKRHGLLSRIWQLTIPSFVFSSFRKYACYALVMHYYINRRVISVLDCCSSSSGMMFHFNWNPVPTYLEQGSILAVTKRELEKLTTKAYRVGNER